MTSKTTRGNTGGDEETSIFRIAPYYYVHILDQNTNVTRIEVGPKTYIRQDNEKVVYGPEQLITIPPRYYCIIENPVVTNEKRLVMFDENGQAKLKHADLVSQKQPTSAAQLLFVCSYNFRKDIRKHLPDWLF